MYVYAGSIERCWPPRQRSSTPRTAEFAARRCHHHRPAPPTRRGWCYALEAARSQHRLEALSAVTRNRNSRVFVGVNDSLASLQALRQAATEARQRHAELHLVHVRPPATNAVALGDVLGQSVPAGWVGSDGEGEWRDSRARQIITTSLNKALGGKPADLDVHYTVLVGTPGAELASLGRRDDDLLVVGTDGGRRWRHPRRRSISRYCATHSRSPVLLVPRAEYARAMRHRLLSRQAKLPRDPWKEFDATSSIPRPVHPRHPAR